MKMSMRLLQEAPRPRKRTARGVPHENTDELAVAYEFRSTWLDKPLLTVITTQRWIAQSYVYELGHTVGDLGGSIQLVAISRAEARALGRREP